MKITIETNETKVTIEEYFVTIQELLDVYKRCAIALTYHENSWKDAIMDLADMYKLDENDSSQIV